MDPQELGKTILVGLAGGIAALLLVYSLIMFLSFNGENYSVFFISVPFFVLSVVLFVLIFKFLE